MHQQDISTLARTKHRQLLTWE